MSFFIQPQPQKSNLDVFLEGVANQGIPKVGAGIAESISRHNNAKTMNELKEKLKSGDPTEGYEALARAGYKPHEIPQALGPLLKLQDDAAFEADRKRADELITNMRYKNYFRSEEDSKELDKIARKWIQKGDPRGSALLNQLSTDMLKEKRRNQPIWAQDLTPAEEKDFLAEKFGAQQIYNRLSEKEQQSKEAQNKAVEQYMKMQELAQKERVLENRQAQQYATAAKRDRSLELQERKFELAEAKEAARQAEAAKKLSAQEGKYVTETLNAYEGAQETLNVIQQLKRLAPTHVGALKGQLPGFMNPKGAEFDSLAFPLIKNFTRLFKGVITDAKFKRMMANIPRSNDSPEQALRKLKSLEALTEEIINHGDTLIADGEARGGNYEKGVQGRVAASLKGYREEISKLGNPAQKAGEIMLDNKTGKIYFSNGTTWSEVK